MATRTITPTDLQQPLTGLRVAQRLVLDTLPGPVVERVAVDEALGRTLLEPVEAPRDVPAFDNSAMDGYAVRADDTEPGGSLVVRETWEPGAAVMVMTGHPIPTGADAVMPWEELVHRDSLGITLASGVAPATNIRPAGEDLRRGDLALTPGVLLGPIHLAIAAAVGRTHLLAAARPLVAIVSTGDEVVAPGEALLAGCVYDANAPLLSGVIRHAGGSVVSRALLEDDPLVLAPHIRSMARAADLIVTSGGASVGARDWMPVLLEQLGTRLLWKVAQKPGKPVAFGIIDGTPVLALPGNPAGVWAAAHTFVAPAVSAMAGRSPTPILRHLPLAAAAAGSSLRTTLQPVTVEAGMAHPIPTRSSVALGYLARAEAIAIVPPDGLAAGDIVEVECGWGQSLGACV